MTDIEKRNNDGVAKQSSVKVSVIFIQDRSGSMQSVWEETLSGFKAFVNRLQQEAPARWSFHMLLLGAALTWCWTILGGPRSAYAQGFSNFKQADGRVVLNILKEDLEKNYYDPSFGGMDLTGQFKQAQEMINSTTSTGGVFSVIALAFRKLNDSHTFFLPPSHASRVEYGWQAKAIGDYCYVAAVKPGSDADGKGLKVGDLVLSVDGHELTRENIHDMHYAYYSLSPRLGMQVVARSAGGQERQLDAAARITQGQRRYDLTGDTEDDIWQLIRDDESESRLYRNRYHETGHDLIIWKMPQFDMSVSEVDDAMKRVRKFKTLILDLRGNGGGAVKTLERLAGYFFDRDVKIADLKGRKNMKPMMAKSQGGGGYKGQLVVVVDSESASASEIFARLIQLEKRGALVGDRTAGAVMQARHFGHSLGVDTVIFYGASITTADVIMKDGNSLEHVGVTPDEFLLPTMEDLASGRDPVLARATALAGKGIEAPEAGALFPIEWRK